MGGWLHNMDVFLMLVDRIIDAKAVEADERLNIDLGFFDMGKFGLWHNYGDELS